MTNGKNRKTRLPEVEKAHEFLEIVRDFTDPKDAIREAISNAMDWDATEIKIIVTVDKTRPEEEIIIEIKDNGVGLDEERLEAFFDLGRSTTNKSNSSSMKIGYKGHGTKTYLNCRQIEVESDSHESSVYAIMDSPLQKLMNGEIPEYEYDVESKMNNETKTKIIIRGYNMNRNIRDFGHNVLKDYIIWHTCFGSVEKEFGIEINNDKKLYLQGLGKNQPEKIDFGHIFPQENSDLKRLQKDRPGDWTKTFVKKWIFNGRQIIDNPSKFVDIVFYIEGDEAKRAYNPMIRVRGKTPEYGMYKVEDMYGLWACKNYIPIKRYNE
ncbi:MAG: ATP-binding protein, partial [bacterium]